MKTKNFTPMPVATRVTARKPRRPEMAVIVRGKFSIVHGKTAKLVENPTNPLVQGFMTADVFEEDDDERAGESLYPSDFADYKPHAEVMLKGSCHTPLGQPVAQCPVRFSVGSWSKSIRVVGRRVFSDSMSGASTSAPIPFNRMPITWANAFGGPAFEANPVGKGIASTEAPTLEPLGVSMRSRSDRIEPVSFGPINPAWAARAKKIGSNYGASWRKERSPFYSDDFDWTHFQSAPADQWLPSLRGDELLAFQNLDPKHQVLETRLPGLRMRAFAKDDRAKLREVKLSLDTLFADLDEGVVYLTWRGLDEVREDDLADVETLLVASEPMGEAALPLDHYRAELEAFEADPLGMEAKRRELTPDVDAHADKLEKLDAFQAAMKDASEKDDPDALEKLAVGALGLADGEAAEKLKRELPGMLATAKKNAPESVPGKDFAARAAKPVKPVNLKLVKPGEAPAIPGKELGDEVRSIKARLPEIEAQLKEANVSTEGFDKIKAALEDPRLARLGEEPPEGTHPRPGEDLSGMDLRGRDLRGADLGACILVETNLSGANLAGASLVGANLERALLAGADLSGANLSNATIRQSVLTGAQAAGASFKGAKLDRALLDGANLRGADFAAANIAMTVFMSADLTGAHAEGAKLVQCMWNEGKLDGAVFDGATLDQCIARRCSLTKASFARARISTTAFMESDLDGASFVDSRGEVAVFQKSTLRDTDFTNADLFRSHFTEAKADRAKLVAADLRKSRFYRTVLSGASFENANLIGADFSKADLTRVRFKGANLYEARFIGAFGASTDFTNANLKRALMERS